MKRIKSLLIVMLLLCTVFLSMPVYVNASVSDNLIMHHDFTDNAKDASGKNNHGTITDGAEIKDSEAGKIITFDGSTGYIDCSDISLIEMSKFTIAFRANSEDLGDSFSSILSSNGWGIEGDTHILFSGGKYYQFSANGSPDIRFETYTVPLNTWEHVTITYDADACTVALYINGSLQEEREVDYLPLLYIDGFAIGSWKNNGGEYERFYNGSFGDFRLYDRVLTSDEIKELSTIKAAIPDEVPEADAEDVKSSVIAAEDAKPAISVENNSEAATAPQTADAYQMLVCAAVLSSAIGMGVLRRKKNTG